MPPCTIAHCPLPGVLLHDNRPYCVPDYRAHPDTVLRPLLGATA